VFWLVEGAAGPECESWQPAGIAVRRHEGWTSIEGRLERRTIAGNDLVVTSFGLEYSLPTIAGGTGYLVLLGPSSEVFGLHGPPSSSGMGFACGEPYITTAASGDVLTVIPGQVLNPLVAFHPDDAERWYLSRAAWQMARQQAAAVAGKGELALVGLGLHHGC
jgi:hypothetical protein